MDYLNRLQEKIGYRFKQTELLKNALTHSSFANERHWSYDRNNERLEFLGDAVLELASSKYIYENYLDMTEGEMTKLRASLVCEQSLALSARELGITEFLYLGKGEKQTGGGDRDSILSDAFEAIIGAVYLDGGFTSAKEFICKFVLSDIESRQLFYDSKTILQEMIQSESDQKVTYQVESEAGPDHQKVYECSCSIGGKRYAAGKGKTKKSAEQMAAYETILQMRQEKATNVFKEY